MTTSKLITACLFSLYILPCSAFGYHILNNQNSSGNFVFLKWKNTPVDLRLDPGTPAGGNLSSIVEEACNTWNNVLSAQPLCGRFSSFSEDVTDQNYKSLTSTNDGKIDVVFDETGDIIADLGLPRDSTLGISSVTSNVATGEIQNVLLVLNGSVQSGSGSDLLSTTIHEMGHGWGLAHIPIGGISTVNNTRGLEPIDPVGIPTMFPFNIPADDRLGRTLEIDDEIGISIRYPAN